MPLPPNTPILVGAGTISQRDNDAARALEPVELMIRALERAAEDAGSRALLRKADSIRAARGFWDYADPCRLIAERFGATRATTEVAEVGVLQTTLFGRACQAIAEGEAEIVLVTGAEGRYRAQRAKIAGVDAPLTQQAPGTAPDSVLAPEGEIISTLEIQSYLAMPVGQYAMVENALRHADGQTLDAHRDEVAALWSRMSDVAADNPEAWTQQRVSAETIRDADAATGNRMLAFPYTKLHNSQWNVDQAAGLIFCSVARAEALGIHRERWVFPLAVADSNYMLPMTQRRALHRCPGFAEVGQSVMKQAACTVTDIAHMELYSCFPVAVRAQLRELGIASDRQHTVTGGMAFGGGPLNNFVLQALAKMVQVLRDDPGSLGLVTAVSGVLTKQGASLWSTQPRGAGFTFTDVSAATKAQIEPVEVVAGLSGRAQIASYTVLFEGEAAARAVLLCDLPDGRRTLVVCHDTELARRMTEDEFCGRPVEIESGGSVRLL